MELTELKLLSIHLQILKEFYGYNLITEKQWELVGKAALIVAESLGYDVASYLKKQENKNEESCDAGW